MTEEQTKLIVRNAATDDIDAIADLVKRVYPSMSTYTRGMLRGQLHAFPEGCWVATFGDRVVGYCATIRVAERDALSPHTWHQITGGGYGSTHDEEGEYLYGYEVCVDPEIRRYRIGQRFYRKRRELVEQLQLKGIVIAGRIPGYERRREQFPTPQDYVDAVRERRVRDPVVNFQLRNGFELIGVLEGYLPADSQSLGSAAHMVWRNPQYIAPEPEQQGSPAPAVATGVNRVRLACVQYGQRRIRSFDQFRQQFLYFVDVTADYRADFVVFPELFTMQLLSLENEAIPPAESMRHISQYEDELAELFREAAMKFNINIVAGSTPLIRNDKLYNIAQLFRRDGTHVDQPKIHPTPNEEYWWNIAGGDDSVLIDTDCGPAGLLVCYDVEFPELVRYLTDQGINLLFVPFLTDEKQSYSRVRYCAQARAVENQLYVAMAGSCGNLPNVNNMDIHYAQSCIMTPCDFPFARDGVAADTTPNVEMVAIADVSLNALRASRQSGTVRNLRDRRHDLYSVNWFGPRSG
ncbi:MAG: GNAT family N-acetyltransferase [Gammaproteobacteria bacterium]|jgi:predicted amidohydrolase/ribosomal protein S18 acetylase RimI-like enzyme